LVPLGGHSENEVVYGGRAQRARLQFAGAPGLSLLCAKGANEEEFIYQPALPFVTPIEGALERPISSIRGTRAADFGAPAEFVSCDLVEIAHNSRQARGPDVPIENKG
jgi:hypothetical protein